MKLQINFQTINKTLVVTFYGELDHHIADEARKKIDDYYTKKMLKNIVFDLKNLNFMDSAGIGLIMGRIKLVLKNDGEVILIHVNSRIKKILNMSGILKIVNVYESLDEALDNL